MITFKKDIFSAETTKRIRETANRLRKDTLQTVGYRNFVQPHLRAFFRAIRMKMPPVTYDVRFVNGLQLVMVRCNGWSWSFTNERNQALYYAPEEVLLTEPVAVSMAIFTDIVNMSGWADHGQILQVALKPV